MGSLDPQALQRAIARNLQRSRPSANSVVAAGALWAALSLTHSPVAEADTFTVSSAADSGFGTLRDAIGLANASAGNTVQFDANLKGSTITLTTGYIDIVNGMTITGPGENLLTISGNHQSRIFYVHTPTFAGVFISGLTLAAGNAGAFTGGAIASKTAGLNLQHVGVLGSSAAKGGGVFALTGSVDVRYSHVQGNSATGSGGGIYSVFADLVLIKSTISDNTAGEYGGGVYAKVIDTPQVLQIYRSTISGNRVPQPGGPALQGGGGIALKSIATNVARLYNATIAGNYAFENGGGIAVLDATTATNLKIAGATISGNSSAASSGNGIAAAAGGNLSATRAIVSGNFSHYGISDLSGTFELHQSLVQNPDSATIAVASSGNQFLVDPLLSALADHGGLTRTMLPAANSPAVDSGGSCAGSDADQRGNGFDRCVNGQYDIGAVERQNPEDIVFRDGFDSS